MKTLLSFIWEIFVFLMSIIQIILIPILFLTLLEILINSTGQPKEKYIDYLLVEIVILMFNGLFLYTVDSIENDKFQNYLNKKK